jgi:hypothetical protein
MWPTSTAADGTESPLFDVLMPIVSGVQSGSAVVTHQTDNKEAAILIRKIKKQHCFVVLWFLDEGTKL